MYSLRKVTLGNQQETSKDRKVTKVQMVPRVKKEPKENAA
ncbi:hypothetical protein PCS8106_01004 [Streptococcus pneumoniae PCS8106]|nr:hypothetical protein PCS8106_01004 [Streptococcus pneumoniae PCS8106]